MSKAEPRCVLVADRHHGLSEGIRGLLATTFDVVVMVADEVSLLESAHRLHGDLAVVDLTLSGENSLELVRELRRRFPHMKVVVLSLYDHSSVSRAVLEAGADGFVLKRSISSDLLAATDAVLAGRQYVSPGVRN